MKLWDILKKVGTGVVTAAIPGAGPVINAVNAFLPDDKKLPLNATGNQVRLAVESLPPEQAALVMMKEFDVDIEEIRSWTEIQNSLSQADASGASTRPWIAKLMAMAVFIAVMIFMAAWAYAIFSVESDILAQLADSWEIMLAVLATPTALLRAYFGMRTKEKQARYNAASGQQQAGGLANIISTFRK